VKISRDCYKYPGHALPSGHFFHQLGDCWAAIVFAADRASVIVAGAGRQRV